MKYPPIKGDIWLNSKPLSKDDLLGKVVLFDFWTYSCVNCQRTLPFLRRWWNKYKDKNFIIIGIHSPEFEFEKESVLVEMALKELGVTWPIVLDNEHENWRNFTNRYWPAKYLCDQNGNIIYSHFGEGEYELMEQKIQAAIKNNSADAELPPIESDERKAGDFVCIDATPELYCGYKRGVFANVGEYQWDALVDYTAPEIIPPNSMAFEGKFIVGSEYADATEHGAAILLNFRATEVNLVMGPTSWGAAVILELDGVPLNQSIMGRHVSGISQVETYKPGLYNLIRSSMPVQGILRIAVFEWSPPFRAYAFTFSGCLGNNK